LLLKLAIKAEGMELFEADSGEQALEEAAEHGPFDLVITDIVMPGMDGVDLAHRLNFDGWARSFLLVSGFCEQESLESRIAGLEAHFLSKPFSIPELIRVVHDMLARPCQGGVGGEPLRRQASY
jgi:two-component system cell cycle sensor histidine kinase/response regulator CckA